MEGTTKLSIIQLGGQKNKGKIHNKENIGHVHQQSRGPSFGSDGTVVMSKPMVIRYIDPRIVPLMVEMGKLSRMVQTFAEKSEQDSQVEEKEELEDMIRSSKDLSNKMSMIME